MIQGSRYPKVRKTAESHQREQAMKQIALASADSARSEAVVECASCAPTRVTLLYESRDKRYCLFEDAAGHITSVRSARLA